MSQAQRNQDSRARTVPPPMLGRASFASPRVCEVPVPPPMAALEGSPGAGVARTQGHVSAQPAAWQLAPVPHFQDPAAWFEPPPKKRRKLIVMLSGAATVLVAGALAAATHLGPYAKPSNAAAERKSFVIDAPVQYIVGDPEAPLGDSGNATPSERKSFVINVPVQHIVGDPQGSAGDGPDARQSTNGRKGSVIEVPVQYIVGDPSAPTQTRSKGRQTRRRRPAQTRGLRVARTAPAAPSDLVYVPPAAGEPREPEAQNVPVEGAHDHGTGGQQLELTPSQVRSRPTKQQVREGIEGLRSALYACAEGTHGTATAELTIAPSGRVTYSLIEGDFAGTPAGTCMARTLRGAAFHTFSGQSFKVRYPLAI